MNEEINELDKITITNKKISKKINDILGVFSSLYSDCSIYDLNIFINAFKTNSLVNEKRTYNDIKRLINIKLKYKDFKLETVESGGTYIPKEKLVINKYFKGAISHELSHLCIREYDNPNDSTFLKIMYETYQKKYLTEEVINNIVKYINDFHRRFYYMINIFCEIYDKRKDKITCDIDTLVDISAANYYIEELYLESLLDALLIGKIYDNDYNTNHLLGHGKEYYNTHPFLSLDEALANYEAIKSLKRGKQAIDKLRELIGDEFVDIFERHIKETRSKRVYIKKR